MILHELLLIALALVTCSKQQQQTQAQPKIEQHPNSIIVNISDPVTLECRASGEPKPKITWLKDGNQLELLANRYTLIHDSNLFIFSATLGKQSTSGNASIASKTSDAGVYQCRAENELGSALSGNATLSITYLKEDFREMPKSRQVNAGTDVIMDCKAPRGLPEPKIGAFNNFLLYCTPVNIKNEKYTLKIYNSRQLHLYVPIFLQ